MRERVKVAHVGTFNLEARTVLGAGLKDVLDIGEGILEDSLARRLERPAAPNRV